MNIAIIIYWAVVVLVLYLVYLINFCAYNKETKEKRDSKLIDFFIDIIMSFIPIINILMIVFILIKMRKYYINTIWTKRL